MRADQDPVNRTKATPPANKPQTEQRCKRCQKVLDVPERETYFARTGMCFWCAYVDSQG
jgi:ribosomal protein L37E